jgi:hypothetical protein
MPIAELDQLERDAPACPLPESPREELSICPRCGEVIPWTWRGRPHLNHRAERVCFPHGRRLIDEV